MRKDALQGIRGLMAIAIVLSHCGYLRGYEETEAFGNYVVCLWGAVTFFFMLSGYFFCYTNKNEKFLYFLVRKIKKLYPLHILTLICSIFIMMLFREFVFKDNLCRFLVNLFLLHAWVPDATYYFSFNAVSWFLSSLLVCYIAGWFFSKEKNILLFVIGGYVVELAVCFMLNDTEHWLLYINPVFRAVDFCFGIYLCQMGQVFDGIKSRWIYTIFEAVSILIFMIAALFVDMNLIGENYSYNCIWIIPVTFIIFFFSQEEGKLSLILKHKYFVGLGNISMELFMTHKFIVNRVTKLSWFENIAEKNAYLSLCIVLILCLFLAFCVHRIIAGIKYEKRVF